MPLASIITCTFNDSEFLPTCLRSCVDHDIDKEIILVDDCSSKPFGPEALAAIKEVGDKVPLRIIRHDKNSGLSASRNTGIAAAASDWVIPMDADDWFYPNAIRTLWDGRTDVDVVTGNCTDSGNVYAPAISRGPLSREVFKVENPLVCSSLFTRDIWKRAGGYTVREGPHYEDWGFWAKCFVNGARFRHLAFNIYNHTSRADSMLRLLHGQREKFVRIATEGVL